MNAVWGRMPKGVPWNRELIAGLLRVGVDHTLPQVAARLTMISRQCRARIFGRAKTTGDRSVSARVPRARKFFRYAVASKPGARRCRVDISNAWPIASRFASDQAGPKKDTPTGSLPANPAGTVRCG